MPGIPNATSDFLRLTLFFRTPTRPVLSVSHYLTSAPTGAVVDDSNIKNIANEAHSSFAEVWGPLADSVCAFTKCKAMWYGPADDGFHQAWSTVAEAPGEVVGLEDASDIGESDALPDWDALLIAKNTGKRKRENRGRFFIPCVAEDASKGGVLQPEYFTKANDLAAWFGGDKTFDGITFHARHWNKKDNVLEVITQCQVMQTMTTRRDRRIVGLNIPT